MGHSEIVTKFVQQRKRHKLICIKLVISNDIGKRVEDPIIERGAIGRIIFEDIARRVIRVQPIDLRVEIDTGIRNGPEIRIGSSGTPRRSRIKH